MHTLGFESGRIYSASEVRIVRKEIPFSSFLLKGECAEDFEEPNLLGEIARSRDWCDRASKNPENYPAAVFVSECGMSPGKFADKLRRLLVDPASGSLRKGLWNFPQLWEALGQWRNEESANARDRIVETEITRQIFEELDFALESRSFVLIEGREGIGKSEAARAWCDQRPGRAIYVRLEAGADETTLYRSIARRIGTACSYQRKAVEMRARIQDALQAGHIALVLDEAHFLWPQAERSERGVPKRMDWVRTALVDFGVPVALISTPQYFARQCDRYRKAGWNANQVQRRLARTATLPETVSADDALKVGRSYFPDASNRLLKRTAGVALLSVGRLTMFSHLRKRVDFLASRRSGATQTELLEFALSEIGAPGGDARASDVQLTPAVVPREALQEASRPCAEPFAGRMKAAGYPLPPARSDFSFNERAESVAK